MPWSPRSWSRTAAVGAALALALTGCGSLGPDRSAARSAAEGFEAAVQSGDGARACHLLATGTASELAQSAGEPCARAVLSAGLPRAEGARQVDVWGDDSRVVLDADVTFLALFAGGWRVTAAGCTPQGDAPYDCIVKGG